MSCRHRRYERGKIRYADKKGREATTDDPLLEYFSSKTAEEAIQFHIEGLREDDLPIPPPSSSVEFVEVRAA